MSTTVSAGFTSAFFSGLLNNLLIVLLSSIVPIGAGIGFTFAMRAIKKRGIRILLRILGVLSYALAPMALMMCLFFNLYHLESLTVIVLSLSLSHLGFFLVFYDNGSSAGKNIAVNILGLLSSVFMWSMAAGYIGYGEMLRICNLYAAKYYVTSYYFPALIAAFAVLLALNIPRMILKERMKQAGPERPEAAVTAAPDR